MGLENRIVYDLVDIVEGTCRLRQAMIRDKQLPELFFDSGGAIARQNFGHPGDMIELTNQLRSEFGLHPDRLAGRN